MEQPLSIKSLRLLTICISIVLIFAIGTLAYSGYQEISYVMSSVGLEELRQKVVMNATQFSISGLNLENRGVYPLTLSMSGDFTLDRVSLGSSSLGPLSIPPGGQRRIDFDLAFNISRVLSVPSLMKKVLFNGTLMSFRFNITGEMQPFVMGTVSGGLNETTGAVLDGFNLKSGTPMPYNATFVQFPVMVEFTNKSPLPLEADLSAQILSTPLQPTIGNYGSGSIVVSTSSGQHYEESLNLYVNNYAVGQGTYLIELSLNAEGFTYTWDVTLDGGI
jgi:hypothetical protein